VVPRAAIAIAETVVGDGYTLRLELSAADFLVEYFLNFCNTLFQRAKE
jgi:hypothetical protein